MSGTALHLKTGKARETAATKTFQYSSTGESLSKALFNPLGIFPVTNCAARIETRPWTILKNSSEKSQQTNKTKKLHPIQQLLTLFIFILNVTEGKGGRRKKKGVEKKVSII